MQQEAKARVRALGLFDFIKTPTDVAVLERVLLEYGFFSAAEQQAQVAETKPAERDSGLQVSHRDMYQEVANVAMGRAGELLARALDVFVQLPVPTVNQIAPSELHMVLSSVDQAAAVSAVTHGFTGEGITGEAMLVFNDTSMKDISRLLGNNIHDKDYDIEALLDISNLIIGACLQGIGEQLYVRMNQAHPVILGRNVSVPELLKGAAKRWQEILAIEIGYKLEGFDIEFDLLLLLPSTALPAMNRQLAYLLDGD